MNAEEITTPAQKDSRLSRSEQRDKWFGIPVEWRGEKFYLPREAWAKVRLLMGKLDASEDEIIEEAIRQGWEQVKANGLAAFKRNWQRPSFEK